MLQYGQQVAAQQQCEHCHQCCCHPCPAPQQPGWLLLLLLLLSAPFWHPLLHLLCWALLQVLLLLC
jgi:hypothetical protein